MAIVIADYVAPLVLSMSMEEWMTYKVIIEVVGGVAYVAECPPEVDVEIRDYDQLEDASLWPGLSMIIFVLIVMHWLR